MTKLTYKFDNNVYKLNKRYKIVLEEFGPHYDTEEIVGSYLGHNPYFPSQKDWLESREIRQEIADRIARAKRLGEI